MSTEENKMIVSRLFEVLANKGDLSIAAQIIAAEHMYHVEQLIMLIRTAFPDFHVTIKDQIAEEDKVAVMFIAHGTHQGETTFVGGGVLPVFVSPNLPLKKQETWPIMNSIPMAEIEHQFTIPPTGKQFTYVGIRAFHIVNGKIINYWGGWLSEIERFLMWAHR